MRALPLTLFALAAPVSAQTSPASLIETAIRAQLKDPDSAKFTWPNGLVSGRWEDLYGHKYYGNITCGTMNAKNGYGGYNGPEAVAAVVSYDGTAIITFETDDSYQGTVNHNYVADQCRKLGIPAL